MLIRKIFMEQAGTGTAAPPTGTPTPPATPPPAVPPVAAPPAPAVPPVTALTAPEPEEIKLTFAEGQQMDKALLDKFLPIAKEAKLTSKQAQALADLYGEGVKGFQTRHAELVTQWAEEAKADPEIGGAKFDATLIQARKVLDRIGTPGLKDILTKSGLGNHKDVIRAFANIGKLIAEDRLPGGPSTAAPQEKSRDEMLKEAFPNSPQMWGGK